MFDIKPCLWFPAEAEEAANFYVSLFPNSKIATVMRGGPGSPAIAVDFVLDGRPFLALNGRQEQGFTDACSFVVTCADAGGHRSLLGRAHARRRGRAVRVAQGRIRCVLADRAARDGRAARRTGPRGVGAGNARHAEARHRGARAGAQW